MEPQTSKQYFNTLKILHLALILGQVFMAGVILFLSFSGEQFGVDNLNNIFIYIIPIVSIASIYAGILISKKRLTQLIEKSDLKSKTQEYRSILIIKYACVEGSSFLTLIVVLLTNNFYFFIFVAVFIGLLVYWRPTKERAINDLSLNQKEIAIIEDPEAIVTY